MIDERPMVVRPADLIFFRDEKSRDKSEKHNQIGVIIDKANVIYSNSRVRSRPLVHIMNEGRFSVYHGNFSDDIRLGVIDFFRDNFKDKMIVESGIKHLLRKNTFPFVEKCIFPKKPLYANDSEYYAAWEKFIKKIRPGDIIFTTDVESLISKFICKFTHGTWSHTAIYLGNGQIQEMVTSGLRRCSIDIYKTPSRWVAAYRTPKTVETLPDQKVFFDALDSQLAEPARYAYKKVIYYGLRSYFGDHSHDWIPNSLIYSGRFFFIAQA